MALQPGTRLGPYEVLELAGAGGMGEVYKARDTRLDRTVAIKVLPAHASGISDLKQRFEREAQTIGSLKHPNICVLHDVGSESGTEFIVMEYLQGETLADRIQREKGRSGSSGAKSASGSSHTEATPGRALKLDEALNIAIQIADALDQAHQNGVTHRDLKPANVMLLPATGGSGSGAHVKLLDFGLAKLTQPSDVIESAETINKDLTGPGVVLGTVRYMAPEQIEGRAVDARTDIFAFGAVLYEMLTGRKAFDGKTQTSLIAAIMNVDPTPLSALMPIAPAALERLVTRCLAKDPDDRWQNAHDLLLQLRWIAGGAAGTASSVSSAGTGRERWTLAVAAAGLVIMAAMALPAWRYLQGPAPADDLRFRIPALGLSASDVAISPDGKTIAMVARPGTEALALYVRPVNQVNFRRLADTDNAAQPFWSPDSRTIGFVSAGRLKKVGAAGAAPLDIAVIDGRIYGASWGPDGSILYGSSTGIRRISSEGGVSELVTNVDKNETGHYWPSFLPDGKHFLYLARAGNTDQRAIVVGSIGTKDRVAVVTADSNALYAQGYLLFHRDATVVAQPFDAERLVLSGGAVQIAGDVGFNLGNARANFDVSQTGNLVYFQGSGATTGRAAVQANWQAGFHNRSGLLLGKPAESGPFGDMDLSPDEKRIAVTRQDPGAPSADIWVVDLERAVSAKLTLDPADDINPVWAPDGDRVAFTTFRKGNADIYVKNANGVGPETPILESTADEYVEDWSKDGRYVAFKTSQGEFEDLYVLPLDAQGKPGTPVPVVQGPYHKDEAQFSYDGHWLAYGSDESGRWEIYVTSFPELNQKLKVTDAGGGRPRWRSDSKEIVFVSPVSPVMAVDFRPGARIDAGIPHQLFDHNAPGGADPRRHLYDVSADGQRVYMRTAASIAGGTQNGVPTVPANFALPNAAGGTAAAQSATVVNPNVPNSNGLTVISNWTAAVRKAAK